MLSCIVKGYCSDIGRPRIYLLIDVCHSILANARGITTNTDKLSNSVGNYPVLLREYNVFTSTQHCGTLVSQGNGDRH